MSVKRLAIFAAVSFPLVVASCGDSGKPTAGPAAAKLPAFGEQSLFGKTLVGAGGPCSLDAINGRGGQNDEIEVVKPNVTFGGWAVDAHSNSVPPEVAIELRGTKSYYAPAVRGKRSDVAKAMTNPAFENAGFDVAAIIESVPPGKYQVLILQKAGQGVLTCETKRSVAVR